jgi:hypothetical protein
LTIEECSKKLVSNNYSSSGIIPHPEVVPNRFEGFQTIIPHEELKRETRYAIKGGAPSYTQTAELILYCIKYEKYELR